MPSNIPRLDGYIYTYHSKNPTSYSLNTPILLNLHHSNSTSYL